MRIPIVPPQRLLFSGGGIRVVSYLGVIKVLHENQLLPHVKEYCGVSAGGLVALMLALGYSLNIIERFCYEYDFSNLRSVEPENALDFLETYGIDTGENLQKLLEKILHHKGFGPNTTFHDLAISGRVMALRVWASDIQFLKPVEFSDSKTPNLPVVFALRATMAIPLYFMPLKHPETNTLLVDGGVLDNYPMSFLTAEEAERTLGIAFEFKNTPIYINDFSSFISLISIGYYRPSYQNLLNKYKNNTIILPCADYSALNFEASLEDRQQLVAIGRQAAEDFFRSKRLSPYIRRHSVC